MATCLLAVPSLVTFSPRKPTLQNPRFPPFSLNSKPLLFNQISCPNLTPFKCSNSLFSVTSRAASSDGFLQEVDRELTLEKPKPGKFVFWVLFWASFSVALFALSGDAKAAVADSIRASNFGLKVANALRGSGCPDEAVVFALATLPVIELRGAIPVGYWMQLNPVVLSVVSILGNMVPVPFIILYLKRFASFLAGTNSTASQFLEKLFENAKKKAGPVEEFQWLGLMLFVAVPFPGTGAWTGAIIASILDMPFWPAFTANFFGVVFAGLLVNLLVNLGLKYAIVTGSNCCCFEHQNIKQRCRKNRRSKTLLSNPNTQQPEMSKPSSAQCSDPSLVAMHSSIIRRRQDCGI